MIGTSIESKFSSKQRNRYLIIIGVLTLLIILISALFNQGATNLAGEYVQPTGVIWATIQTTIFTIPLLGFIIGSIIGLIPHKELAYKKRWIKSSLLVIIIIDSLFILSFIITNLFVL